MQNVISLQVGQCGNQVGCEFFKSIAQEAFTDNGVVDTQITSRFFREARSRKEASLVDGNLIARSCLIDMEPKVIQQSLLYSRNQAHWRFSPSSTFSRQSGSANNWAWGYAVHGPTVADGVYNTIRREAECCDSLGTFVLLQSLAGGTGSGVGTFLSECLGEWFPNVRLLNQVVWPYGLGEVVVQNLNALLSLAHLHAVTDGMLVVENDVLQAIAATQLGLQKPSFADLNAIIAHHLAAVLLPASPMQVTFTPQRPSPATYTSGGDSALDAQAVLSGTPVTKTHRPQSASTSSSRNASKATLSSPLPASYNPSLALSTVLDHVFPLPTYRLSSLAVVPHVAHAAKAFEATTWQYVGRHLLQQHLTPSSVDTEGPRTAFNALLYGQQRAPITTTRNRAPASRITALVDWTVRARHHLYLTHPYLAPDARGNGSSELSPLFEAPTKPPAELAGLALPAQCALPHAHSSLALAPDAYAQPVTTRMRSPRRSRPPSSRTTLSGSHAREPSRDAIVDDMWAPVPAPMGFFATISTHADDVAIEKEMSELTAEHEHTRATRASTSARASVIGRRGEPFSAHSTRQRTTVPDPPRYGVRAVSSFVVCRGDGAYAAAKSALSDPLLGDLAAVRTWSGEGVASRGRERERDSALQQGFNSSSLYAGWHPSPLLMGFNEQPLAGDPRMAATWSCSQRLLPPLEHMVTKAWDMNATGAYVHHYERCGLERDDFMHAFATMESVVQDYKDM